MQPYLICRDPNFAQRVRGELSRCGLPADRFPTINVSQAAELAANVPSGNLAVFFVCATRFETEECDELSKLAGCVGGQGVVAAVGTATDSQTMLRTIRHGAVDYLHLGLDFKNEIQTLIERLGKTRALAKSTYTLAVMGVSGGVGASFLAANLAAIYAQRRRAVCLLDLQYRGGVQSLLFNAAPRYDIAALAEKVKQLDAAMFEQSLFVHDSGVRLLGYPTMDDAERSANGELIEKIVGFARDAHDCVVIDAAEGELAAHACIVDTADAVVVTIRPDFVSLCRTIKTLERLRDRGIGDERIHCVLNRADQPHALPESNFFEALNKRIETSIPDDPGQVNASFNLGQPLALADKPSKVATSLRGLAERLIPERTRETGAERPSLLHRLCKATLRPNSLTGRRVGNSLGTSH